MSKVTKLFTDGEWFLAMSLKDPEKNKEYQRRWRQEHPDYGKQKTRRWKEQNREKYLELSRKWARQSRERLKNLLFETIGSSCERCGIEDARVLQFHHTDGKGKEHREEKKGTGSAYYKSLLNMPKGQIIVLCANCHIIKDNELGLR